MTLLYSVAWPGQGLYTKNPLKSVDDFKGVKFRTYSAYTRGSPSCSARARR
jgi:TRAP-type C4-dicarboxylate transport system substrate-binding protein